jgi:hypothetical protein
MANPPSQFNDAGGRLAFDKAICKAAGSVAGLAMIPEFATVFHHVSAPCQSLASEVLLKNNGTTMITVEQVGARPGSFSAEVDGLPREVAPGGTLPVRVQYITDVAKVTQGVLSVVTSSGCAEFDVQGLGVDNDSLLTFSALAMDFGPLRARGASEARDVTVLMQRPATGPTSTLFDFAAGPKGVFDLVSGPAGKVVPASCETITLSVRFKAPAVAGPADGALSWEVTTETPQGDADALVSIPLLGTAVEP